MSHTLCYDSIRMDILSTALPSRLASESAASSPSTARRLLMALLGAWILVILPTCWSMAEDWWVDPNYSHGLVILPCALYFLWRGRAKWLAITPRASWWGLAVFAGAALVYLVGTAAAENFSTRVAAVTGLAALAWALLGWRFLRTAWFPFVFLFFAVPWPYIIYYQITFPLQLFSTRMACVFLDWFGITFVRQGNIIHLPNYALEVVEACSGVRSLLTLTTLGAAYAYLTQPGTVRPWLLFLLAVPIALSANVIRLVLTALAAYGWGPGIAETFLHDLGGFLLFSVALITLIVAGALLTWIARRSSPASL